jgi:hypothetical protein
VSNELSNNRGADQQPPLDDPGSFGAPGLAIGDHLTCFTPKRSLVRAQIVVPKSRAGVITGCAMCVAAAS